MSQRTRFAVLLAGALAAAAAVSCKGGGAGGAGGAAQNEVLIGEYGSMTGAEATFGQSTHNGLTMAIEELNGAGGIRGRKVRLVSYDDQGKTSEVGTAVTRLITSDGVLAVIGEVASS